MNYYIILYYTTLYDILLYYIVILYYIILYYMINIYIYVCIHNPDMGMSGNRITHSSITIIWAHSAPSMVKKGLLLFIVTIPVQENLKQKV